MKNVFITLFLTLISLNRFSIRIRACINSLLQKQSVVDPQNFADLERLEGLVLTILRKYITKFYRLAQQQVNTDNMTLDTLRKDDPNLNFGKWKISFRSEDTELVQQMIEYGEEMKRLAEAGDIYSSALTSSLAVYIENHLYHPLLTMGSKRISCKAHRLFW